MRSSNVSDKLADMFNDLLAVLGLAALLTGLALWSVPLALVVGGLLTMGLGVQGVRR